MSEIIDVVNDNNEVIGQATRKEVYTQGLNCRIIHIYIEDENGDVLVARRGSKVTRPHMLCATVAGHVDAGEEYEQAALREGQEELGVALHDLEHIGNCTSETGQHFCQVYFAKHKEPLAPCEREIDRLVAMTIEEVDHLTSRFPFMFMGSFHNSFEIYKEYRNV